MTFATVTAAYDAIMDFFKSGWALAYPAGDAPFVVFPDQKQDTPPDQSPWVRLVFQHNQGFQATISPSPIKRFRKKGKVTFELRTPLGDGLTVSQGLIDTVLGIFEGKSTGPDAVIFRDCVPLEVGPDGAFFFTKVVVNFEYDQMR